MESKRFQSWSDQQITLGIRKYWGKIDGKMTGDYQIAIDSYNSFTDELVNNLQFEISDNLALSGYNVSLSVVNFGWAAVMFLFTCLAFYFRATDPPMADDSTDAGGLPTVTIALEQTNF